MWLNCRDGVILSPLWLIPTPTRVSISTLLGTKYNFKSLKVIEDRQVGQIGYLKIFELYKCNVYLWKNDCQTQTSELLHFDRCEVGETT